MAELKSLRRMANLISGGMGRNSRTIKILRPAYNSWLEWSSGDWGMTQTLNNVERFSIDPKHRTHFPDVYDPSVCDFLRTHVKQGDVSLNIGAHVGIYALCLAAWSSPDGQVIAFEPNPLTRAVLEKHVKLNAYEQRIEVVAQAVSNRCGEMTFFATGLEGFSRLEKANPALTLPELTEAVTVPVTSIDAFCAARNLTPNWIVMDIEGYEIAALSGARQMIQDGGERLGIIVEMHPTLWEAAGSSRAQFEALLDELSLKPICLTGQSNPYLNYGIVILRKS